MNYLNFKFEIAKAIILALRWVNSLINYLPKNIDSFWFSNIKHSKNWLNSSEAQKYSVLIDTNVISPQWEIWSSKERKLERLNFRQISGGELDFDNLSSSIAIASKYEVDSPGELFLSSQWLDFLERLSSIGQIGIFGIAEIELGNLWNAEFFLGLAHGSCTTFIE